MPIKYFLFGKPYADLNPDHLTQVVSKKTFLACLAHSNFKVVELRRLDLVSEKIADIIVVECFNDQIPTRNLYEINVREQLALVFTLDKTPEVRALRMDFPVVPHLNIVQIGEPYSLCLYFEPWSAIERTWTPQNFLQRILWWLTETAKNTLHRPDQPVEPIYFGTPCELVLPPDFDEKIKNAQYTLSIEAIEHSNGEFKVIKGRFETKAETRVENKSRLVPLVLMLSPVIHGRIERYPETLGELHDQIMAHGALILKELKECIRNKAKNGLSYDSKQHCLLIIHIPICRSEGAAPERYETRAFFINRDITEIGKATGALFLFEKKYYPEQSIGKTHQTDIDDWRNLDVLSIDIRMSITKDFARSASSVNVATADFKGVLAGVGALGSSLADIWAKEAWGIWTFIDNDIIEAHNIVRHAAKDLHIGWFKVDAVRAIVEANYHSKYFSAKGIAENVTNWSNPYVKNAITTADIIVDATTTLEVPRELSQREDCPRSVSVFLTPSGNSSVILFESTNRSERLDFLEAQYYRAIINADWGVNHLLGHNGALWIGAGCRDASAVISNESIQVHAATLARQIRLLRDKPEPHIRVWTTDVETGSLIFEEVPISVKVETTSGEWRVIWDAEIQQKLNKIRNDHLPRETGGVILGYIDQKLKAIYIVDVLTAPADSESDQTGFVRGVDGLEATLKEVSRRTANIVGYIGEWHSHPAFASAYPSSLDRTLIEKLSNILALDGQPALMVIVGLAGDISVTVKGG